MATLGNAKVYFKHDQLITGVVFLDGSQNACAGSPLKAFRPKSGDRFIVEFEDMDDAKKEALASSATSEKK